MKVEDRSERSLKSLGNLVEKVTPWLLDVGSWIFGGLIAVNLVVIASLITGIAALSVALTLAGLVAALWHMAWWIGVVLLAMAVVSAISVVLSIALAQPPRSEAEKTLGGYRVTIGK